MTVEITGAEFIPYSVPLGGWRGSSGGVREGWLLRLEHGRVAGWGEASPLEGFSLETVQEVRSALGSLCETLRGLRFDPMAPVDTPVLDTAGIPPSVRFAAELALLNLASEVTGKSPGRILNPSARPVCPIAALIEGSFDVCVERAGEIAPRGYTVAKMKVGSADPETDARRVRAVTERLGPAVRIRLDANRAWSWEQAMLFVRSAGDFPVDFVEEPLAEPARLAAFAVETGLPVALDESLAGSGAGYVEPFEGLAALVLKPTILGGLHAARRIASHADSIGVDTVVSSTFETGVGLRGLAHLAASLSDPAVPAGLGTAAWLMGDTTTPPFPADVPIVDLSAGYEVNGSPEIAS